MPKAKNPIATAVMSAHYDGMQTGQRTQRHKSGAQCCCASYDVSFVVGSRQTAKPNWNGHHSDRILCLRVDALEGGVAGLPGHVLEQALGPQYLVNDQFERIHADEGFGRSGINEKAWLLDSTHTGEHLVMAQVEA